MTTIHDYEHWNEEAPIIRAAESSTYDDEYWDEDWYDPAGYDYRQDMGEQPYPTWMERDPITGEVPG